MLGLDMPGYNKSEGVYKTQIKKWGSFINERKFYTRVLDAFEVNHFDGLNSFKKVIYWTGRIL